MGKDYPSATKLKKRRFSPKFRNKLKNKKGSIKLLPTKEIAEETKEGEEEG